MEQKFVKPKRVTYKNEDYLFAADSYSTMGYADSVLKIETSDRGQDTDNPKRDLRFEFSRVSRKGNMSTGCITFSHGEEVAILMEYLNDKFGPQDSTKVAGLNAKLLTAMDNLRDWLLSEWPKDQADEIWKTTGAEEAVQLSKIKPV